MIRIILQIKELYKEYWECMISKDIAEHDEITADVSGEKATLIGKSKVVAAVYGGGKSKWRLRGDFTLRKENGQWKLVSSRASTY